MVASGKIGWDEPATRMGGGTEHRVDRSQLREQTQPALEGSLMGEICKVGGDKVASLRLKGTTAFIIIQSL